jgi:cellulose synthase/poly-beta-1,6-N-acetylglucosamine synthase-like glycosyltransferase
MQLYQIGRIGIYCGLMVALGLYPYTLFHHHHYYISLIIMLYFILQIVFATMNFREMKKDALEGLETMPTVSFLVIGYRENPEYWAGCVKSLLEVDYPNLTSICAFIDGNEPDDMYMKSIFEEAVMGTPIRCRIRMCEHGGKRHAMDAGFRYIREKFPENEYIVVIDSDTLVEKDALYPLVSCIHRDERNGCATGNIRIFNTSSILSRIINARYAYAFNIERGAMSAMGVMNCCSGPFSIYRQQLLDDDFLEEFLGQTCCGQSVGPGDDRHATLLLMKKGYLSRQTSFAVASTETPATIHRYLQQQLRWMRSFYREQVWQIQAIPEQNPYLALITAYELMFPFLLVVSFLPTFDYLSLNLPITTPMDLLRKIGIAFGILGIRTTLLLVFHGFRTEYLWNMCILPLYFTMLLPLKYYALATCGIQNWMTSTRKTVFANVNPDVMMIYTTIFLWNAFVVYGIVRVFSN